MQSPPAGVPPQNAAESYSAQAALQAKFSEYERKYAKNPGNFDKFHDRTKGWFFLLFLIRSYLSNWKKILLFFQLFINLISSIFAQIFFRCPSREFSCRLTLTSASSSVIRTHLVLLKWHRRGTSLASPSWERNDSAKGMLFLSWWET